MPTNWKPTIAFMLFVLVARNAEGQSDRNGAGRDYPPYFNGEKDDGFHNKITEKKRIRINSHEVSNLLTHILTPKPKFVEKLSATKSSNFNYKNEVHSSTDRKPMIESAVLSETDHPLLDSSCKSQTFCEESSVKNYPEEAIKNALRTNNDLGLYFSSDTISNEIKQHSYSDKPDEIPLCSKTEKVIYPRAALNMKNQWQFIVNKEDFRQGIRIELCNDQENSCKWLDLKSESYKSRCKQNYIYRQLVSYRNGTLELASHRFPVSCSCYLRFLKDPSLYGIRQ